MLSCQYDVSTLGIETSNDYSINLANEIPNLKCQYDVVFHAAGKAHIVPRSEADCQSFFDINFHGTENICAALEKNGLPRAFIFVSTVAVYGCEKGNDIGEDHPLDGDSSYARSKIMAELFLENWCKEHGVVLSIIRPSLIAGKCPPGNLGRMIDGISKGRYLSISGGHCRKSILMVDDLAILIPKLADRGGVYNICNDENPSFSELESIMAFQLGKRKPIVIPRFLARMLACFGNIVGPRFPFNSNTFEKMTSSLTFSNQKAKSQLNWQPKSVVDNFVIR